MRRARWVRAVVAGILAAVTTASCSNETERPRLADEPAVSDAGDLPIPPVETGVAEVDAMLARLDGATDLTFTATYDVLRRFGGVTTEAVVTQQPPVSVLEVGDTLVRTGPDARTCDSSTGTCEEGVVEQRLSETVLTSGFWASAPAAAIRTAMARRVGEVTVNAETVGGQPAECVAIPVAGGTDTYCVSEAGVIARVDTAATLVALTSYADAADPALLERNP